MTTQAHRVLRPQIPQIRARYEQRDIATRYAEFVREQISVDGCEVPEGSEEPRTEYTASYTLHGVRNPVQIGIIIPSRYPSVSPLCRVLGTIDEEFQAGVRNLRMNGWNPDLTVPDFILWLKPHLQALVHDRDVH